MVFTSMVTATEQDLQAWLAKISRSHNAEIELGLERFAQVAAALGLSQQPSADWDVTVITVAGTNGKGSTIACMEHLLLRSDISVAAYTSPHLLHFTERLRVEGDCSNSKSWLRYFEQIEQVCRALKISLTFFEVTTLGALLYLSELYLSNPKPQVWLMEIGLGGRLDAVNWLTPDISVLTHIGFDHQAWLGDTLESIAFEKCGIMRPQRPIIFGGGEAESSTSVVDLVRQQAQQFDAILVECPLSEVEISTSESGTWGFDLARALEPVDSNPLLFAQLSVPRVAKEAVVAAVAALSLSKYQSCLTQDKVSSVCCDCQVLARFQLFTDDPQLSWLIDVAHNSDAAIRLKLRLEALLMSSALDRPFDRVFAVVGVMSDKEWQGVVIPFLDVIDGWFVAQPELPRALASGLLANYLTNNVVKTNAFVQSLPVDSQQWCDCVVNFKQQVSAKEKVLVLVFGSFYTVAPVLRWLT